MPCRYIWVLACHPGYEGKKGVAQWCCMHAACRVDLSRKGSIAVEHSGTSLRMLRVLFDKLPRIYDDTCKVENVDALQYMSLASASAVAAARVNPALHEVGTLAKNAGASIKEFFKEPPANVKNVFKDPGSSMKGMFKDAERGLKGVFEKGVFKRGDKDAAGAASAAATTANVAAASTSQPVAVMTGGSTEPCAAAEAGVQPTDAEPTTTPTNLATTSPMPVSAAAAAAAPAPSPRTSQPGSAWPTTISAAEATSRFAGVVRAAGAADVGQWGADVPVAVDAASKLP